MTKIAVIVGSLHKNSVNKLLAQNLEKLAPQGVEFDYVNVDVPLFNQDLEVNPPESVKLMKQKVEAADAVLLVTPEYNRSTSGVLKNATDWISRPYGHNSFAGKPTGIVGATGATTGTLGAQNELRHIATYLDMRIMAHPEIYLGVAHTAFDENGEIIEASRNYLQQYIDAFNEFVAKEKLNK